MHNIFNERFISSRIPAWHRLGVVHHDEIGATESLERIGGQPLVTLEPIYSEVQGETLLLPQRTIMRHPTEGDPSYIPFGIVGPQYQLLTLDDVADIWDKVVGKPIETMGILGRGENAFLTSKLPAVDVKGDAVDRYIGVTTPLDGLRVATAEEWDIRVVCQNTLKAAQAQALSTCRVVHNRDAKTRMAFWLKEAYAQAESNVSVVREVFEILATHSVRQAEVKAVLEGVYPLVKANCLSSLPPHINEKRAILAEAANRRHERYREAVWGLFEGQGTGMDVAAAKGTGWGLYNAVVEASDYRKGTDRSNRSEADQVAESTMFGVRSLEKQRAFNLCLAFATGKVAPEPPLTKFQISLN